MKKARVVSSKQSLLMLQRRIDVELKENRPSISVLVVVSTVDSRPVTCPFLCLFRKTTTDKEIRHKKV